MIKCPYCQTNNVDNTIFCNECGASLLEDDKARTDPLEPDETGWSGDKSGPKITLPPAQPDLRPTAIRLIIGPGEREVEMSLQEIIRIGRLDPATKVFPEVDLTADIAPEKSVSRRHAVIFKRENSVMLEDVGSINGTFINGKRLDPFVPEILNDGDTLQLGRLLIKVQIVT